jgi:hypothetical protein
LTLNPSRKLGASLVRAWDEAVSVDELELLQLLELIIPCSKVRVPDKSDLVQLLDSINGEVRVFTHGSKLELVTLALDPLEKGCVALVRDIEVSFLLVELNKFLEAVHPPLVLEGVVPDTGGSRGVRDNGS